MTLEEKKEIIKEGTKKLTSFNKDIKGVLFAGSFNKGTMHAYSDIDIYMVSNEVKKYTNDDDDIWIEPFGKILSKTLSKGRGYYSRKILTETGIIYDFTIISVKTISTLKKCLFLNKKLLPKAVNIPVVEMISPRIYTALIEEKCEVYMDKINVQGILNTLSKSRKDKNRITQGIFIKQYNTFWYGCYSASVKIIKKDFVYFYMNYDWRIRGELIRMIEWDILSDRKVNVHYKGKEIEEWAGIELVKRLYTTLPGEDLLSAQFKLLKTINLYTEFSDKVAKKYNYPVNKDLENFVISFIEKQT
jgi:predicted nucleotidyltransferase